MTTKKNDAQALSLLCDAQGFLQNTVVWDEATAILIAKTDNIVLTDAHWRVIQFLRGYYHQYKHFPTMRIFVKLLNETFPENLTDSVQLHQLFPGGVLKQSAKFAGLPKPPHCV